MLKIFVISLWLCIVWHYLYLFRSNYSGTEGINVFCYSCFWWHCFLGGRRGTFWGIWPEHFSSGLWLSIPFRCPYILYLPFRFTYYCFHVLDCWQGSTRTSVPLKRIRSTTVGIWLCECTNYFANWQLFGGKVCFFYNYRLGLIVVIHNFSLNSYNVPSSIIEVALSMPLFFGSLGDSCWL